MSVIEILRQLRWYPLPSYPVSDTFCADETLFMFKALLSLNIGFAIVSTLFIYDNAHHLADAPKMVRECLQAFSRMLFHIAPLSLHSGTKYELQRNAGIREAVFLGLTLAVALFLYPLTKLAAQSDLRRPFFISLSGLSAFGRNERRRKFQSPP
jgi:hypothetical protein